MNDELDQKPDAALDDIFAREVAHWHTGCHKDGEFPSYWYDATGKLVYLGAVAPKFTEDANAVLTWLEKHPYVSIARVNGDGWQVSILYHKDIPQGGYEEGVMAESWQDTFARAAVIALIRAARTNSRQIPTSGKVS